MDPARRSANSYDRNPSTSRARSNGILVFHYRILGLYGWHFSTLESSRISLFASLGRPRFENDQLVGCGPLRVALVSLAQAPMCTTRASTSPRQGHLPSFSRSGCPLDDRSRMKRPRQQLEFEMIAKSKARPRHPHLSNRPVGRNTVDREGAQWSSFWGSSGAASPCTSLNRDSPQFAEIVKRLGRNSEGS